MAEGRSNVLLANDEIVVTAPGRLKQPERLSVKPDGIPNQISQQVRGYVQ